MPSRPNITILFPLLLVVCAFFGTNASADTVILVTGSEIEAEEVIKEGDNIICVHNDGTQSTFPQAWVKEIISDRPIQKKRVQTKKIIEPGIAFTTGSGISCFSEEWLEEVMQFYLADDIDGVTAFTNEKKCLLIDENIQVTVLKVTSTGRVLFLYDQNELWTSQEFLKGNR